METDFLYYIIFIILMASFVQGSIGFGFPMLATTFLTLFIDIETAIFFTLVPAFFLNILSIKSEGNILPAIKKYYPFALLSLLGSMLGMQILLTYEWVGFKVILAFMILLYLFLNKVNMNILMIKKFPRVSYMIFGFLSGFIGGLTNAVAPIFLFYALESNFSRRKTIQVGNLCFLSVKISQIVLFYLNDDLQNIDLTFSLAMLVAVALMFYIGINVKQRINQQVYTKCIRALLFISALVLIFKSLSFL